MYQRIQENPDNKEEESFYTKALKEFIRIKKDNPEIFENMRNYPPRIKVAKAFAENELLVFLKKGRLYVRGIKYDNDAEVYSAAFEDAFEKIVCGPEEKRLSLSEVFWEKYEQVNRFKEYRLGPVSEQSLEQKALNNLDTYINKIQLPELMPHKDFLRTLREDILDYATLSDFTLRRIANLESADEKKQKEAVEEITALKQELGEDYLIKEKARHKEISKEIIIAVENRIV